MKILINIVFVVLFLCISLDSMGSEHHAVTDIIVIRDDNFSSSSMMIQDARNFGYHVTTAPPDSVNLEVLNQYQLVILSTGNNPLACTNNEMRVSIQTFIDNGGLTIIEGGDNAYISFVLHQYPAFRTKVLKTSGFVAHNGGNLVVAPEYTGTNLFTSPNFLPATVLMNFVQNSDMDVCTNDKFSNSFFRTTLFSDKAGIIVAPSVSNPQIINFCFSYAAVASRSDAKSLLANSIYNLIGKPISITTISTEIPEDFELNQNYPNPFNPVTVIRYSLSENRFVTLKVYDILGNEVSLLFSGPQNAGSYEIKFDGSNLSSGIYFYTLKAEGFTDTKRMIFLK